MKEHVRTLSRATLASAFATATEIGLLWLLVHPLHVPRWVAFWVVQFYCNAATFLLYKYWAFDAAQMGRLRTQYVKQLVIFGGSLALNTAIPSFLTYRLHVEPVVAFIGSQVVVYLAWNYPGNRYWVFRREEGGA
ncbi:MAG: GtrA-like protein [bacterium]|nr:GtrA-like protein [bacterium]